MSKPDKFLTTGEWMLCLSPLVVLVALILFAAGCSSKGKFVGKAITAEKFYDHDGFRIMRVNYVDSINIHSYCIVGDEKIWGLKSVGDTVSVYEMGMDGLWVE